MRNALLRFLPALLIMWLFAACESDTYDTGDGKYSYMRADFAEVYTDDASRLVKAVTDDDDLLVFDNPVSVSWITTPDSVYRALLYYNSVGHSVRPVMLGNVYVPPVRMADDVKDPSTDPLHLDSSWMSRNGKYINLGITVMAGKDGEDTDKQSIGVACDGMTVGDDGAKEVRLRVLHNQNDVPQYYSVRTYISIPLAEIPYSIVSGDRIVVNVNTYGGEVSKEFML